MTRCGKCALYQPGKNFAPDLLRHVPLHLRRIFICDEATREARNPEEVSQKSLCPLDLWVLTFIGKNEPFAIRHAGSTLDRLVATGCAELLCNMFENASYSIRRDLWLRMTEHHADRLYLFDALFERDCLPPVNNDMLAQKGHLYQFSLLQANSASAALFDDLI
ncbi:MAG: hypothetical protein ACOYXC_09290 [Candidatus Rifleibacteriota bacterium]